MADPKLRAVVDTSVFVAAVLSPDGPAAQVIEAARRQAFTMVTSAPILDELVDVLARKKVQKKVPLSVQDIANIRVAFEQLAQQAPGEYQDIELVPTDPKDNPVAAAALEKQVEYVISLDDRDLLSLKTFRVAGHAVIQIVMPRDFLKLLEE